MSFTAADKCKSLKLNFIYCLSAFYLNMMNMKALLSFFLFWMASEEQRASVCVQP